MKIQELIEKISERACVQLLDVVGNEYALIQLVQRYTDSLSDHLNLIGEDDWTITDVNRWAYYMLDVDDGDYHPIPVYTGDTVTLWNDLYLDERVLVGDDPMELGDVYVYRVSDVIDYELAILNSFILNEIEYAAESATADTKGLFVGKIEKKGENNANN
jgi:hypothetical protein